MTERHAARSMEVVSEQCVLQAVVVDFPDTDFSALHTPQYRHSAVCTRHYISRRLLHKALPNAAF